MKNVLPPVIVGIVIAVVFVALFTLKKSPVQEGPSTPGGTPALIITSANNQGIQDEFARAFEAWHREKFNEECKIEWRDHGGTSEIFRYIKSEFEQAPNGISLDIVWGGGVEPFIQLAQMGLLAKSPMPEEIMKALPDEVAGVPLYNEEKEWYGTALSSFGIIYNIKQLKEANLPTPKTWADLAEPAFINEVAAADPRASGTAQTMVEVILQAYGWEKGFDVLTRMGGNVKSFSRSAGDVPKNVSLGETAAGLAIDFYAWTQIQRDGKDKIGFILPEGLTPITPDAIGVLKGAPHEEHARRFVQFVLSPQGQRLWVLPKGAPGGPVENELLRIPVLPAIYQENAEVTNVLYDPSKAVTSFDYDPAKASQRRDIVKDLYGALIIDLAPELTDAWRGIIRRGMKADEIQRLTTPPVSEKQALELAAKWSDPALRNQLLTEWQNAARGRYKELAR